MQNKSTFSIQINKIKEKIVLNDNTVNMSILFNCDEPDLWRANSAEVIVGFGRKCQSTECVFTMFAYTLADTLGVRVLFGLVKST